jgi:hypothetical protein
MSHYVCKGECKTVSDKEGVCEADFCNKKGEELEVCGCEDGEHGNDSDDDMDTGEEEE